MLTAALFVMVENWKQRKYLLGRLTYPYLQYCVEWGKPGFTDMIKVHDILSLKKKKGMAAEPNIYNVNLFSLIGYTRIRCQKESNLTGTGEIVEDI